jgi:hypothetical protein
MVVIDVCRVRRGAGPTADLQQVLVQNSQGATTADDLSSEWARCRVERELKDNDTNTSLSRRVWGKQAEPR